MKKLVGKEFTADSLIIDMYVDNCFKNECIAFCEKRWLSVHYYLHLLSPHNLIMEDGIRKVKFISGLVKKL